MRVLAQRNRREGAADDAGHSGEPGAEREHQNEQQLHAIAEHGKHVAVIDAGAYHDPDARAIERKPHRDPDHHRGGEDGQPHAWILQEHRFAA